MNNRQQKKPYDFFNKDVYEWILYEFQTMFEDIYFIESLQKILQQRLEVKKQFMYNSSSNILPIWNPVNKEINYNSLKTDYKKSKKFFESEQSIDILESDEDVTVTVEIPNVEKNDIDIYIKTDSFEMIVDSSLLKFYKMLKLPCNVNAETAEATYNNGVLDVVIKKRKKPI